jgi:hypothetical protein
LAEPAAGAEDGEGVDDGSRRLNGGISS